MRESHTCGSKIVISFIKTVFLHPNDNKNSIFFLAKNSSGESGFEVLENLSTQSVIFGSRQEIFGNLREVIENLPRSSEVFGNLQQSSDVIGKSSEIQVLWRGKISCILLGKKNLQVYLIIQFLFYYMSNGCLHEVKNKRKFQTVSSKSGRGRSQSVVTHKLKDAYFLLATITNKL